MALFKDKHAVVTGASSGIGTDISRRLVELGATVTLFARNEERLKKLTEELGSAAHYVVGDIRYVSDLEKLYEEIEFRGHSIDILIANAGIACRLAVDDVTEEIFDDVFDTNVKGVFFTVQKAIPLLTRDASVVLISSIAGKSSISRLSVYSATKAAVSQLAVNLGADLVDRGIRVNAVSPGFTDTPIFDSVIAMNPAYKKERGETLPMKRFAKPSEITEAVIYLSSPAASYISGIDLTVDGGSRFANSVF